MFFVIVCVFMFFCSVLGQFEGLGFFTSDFLTSVRGVSHTEWPMDKLPFSSVAKLILLDCRKVAVIGQGGYGQGLGDPMNFNGFVRILAMLLCFLVVFSPW